MSNAKKLSAGMLFNACAAVLELIGLICFAIMAADGNGVHTAVWATAIVGIVLQLGVIVGTKKGSNVVCDLAGIVIAVLYALSLVLMIQQRMASVTLVFANHVGTIGMPFVLCAVFFLMACLVQMIEGFVGKSSK